ncbi:MAG TPA: glycerol-3-phosphate acyltransferase [Acidimicrobiia bacterium]|nr:glycerol-3-phosphate acyltransferase [Acidimicrobiia bacterium]
MYWPVLLVGAYLLGSIPFAQVIGRVRGIDLRQVGTGNVGAGNLTRVAGWPWGLAAGVCDGLKGLFPVLLVQNAGFGKGAAGMVGLMAVIGHNWSLFMRGRSGRGLATAAGMLAALDPVLLVWTTGWSVAGWKIGGGVAGFLGWGLLPIVAATMGRPPTESFVLLALSGVLMARRMQGNPDSPRGVRPAMRRAVFDTDPGGEDFPRTADDPLTP